MDDFRKAALQYVARGWRVFPCKPGEKVPATAHGFQDATTNVRQINAWWDANPVFNVGIATSRDLFVVDLDEDQTANKHGVEYWKRFQHSDTLPMTATVSTPRGGRHLYFTGGNDTVRTRANVYPGVDVRADGGYVLAPPSIVGGKSYTWERHPIIAGIAEAGEDVFQFLAPALDQVSVPFTVPSEIPEGSRVQTLVRLIGSLRAKGVSDEAIRAAVREENDGRCVPPLTDVELEQNVFPALTRGWAASHPYDQAVRQAVETEARQRQNSVEVTCLADIEEREAEWLVPGFIPKRELTLLARDGGVGKSFCWCSLAAALTTGKKPFFVEGGHAEYSPQRVMFFSSEDSAAYVLKRRLREHGADMTRIFTIDAADERFSDIHFGSAYLERLLETHRPALCIFDPLQSFMPAGTSLISRSDVRAALGKLHVFGEKYGTTFLILMHSNKAQSVWGRTRLADSADLWDGARSVLIAGLCANRKETGERIGYLSHEKSNYGALCRTTLFKIHDGLVRVEGYTDKRDRDFVLEASKQRQQKTPAVDEAVSLINDLLDRYGTLTPVQILASAQDNGISKNAIRQAKERMTRESKLRMTNTSEGRGKGVQRLYSRPPWTDTQDE